MKPPPFDYLAPTTVADAVAALTNANGDARPLAGGQSLIPMLNFRLAAPSLLVDLRRIEGLSGVSISSSSVRIGATTRTARLISEDVEQACPVLTAAARLVAHPQIRSRGTIGGSIANADPAAELPAVALLMGASMYLVGPGGERTAPAENFFQGVFTTACAWNEILVAIEFPTLKRDVGWGFREFARRPGDFALAGIGALVTLIGASIGSATVVVFGAGPKPERAFGAERVLIGNSISAATLSESRRALEGEISSDHSVFASSHYRRHTAGVLFEQVMADALGRAGMMSDGARRQ